MNSKDIILILLVAFAGKTFSQQLVPSGCDLFQVQQNFNLTAYLGRWYEIEATSHFQEAGGICIEANYADFNNGSIEVYNKMILQQSGQWSTIIGNARPLNSSSTEAKYLVSFPVVGAYNSPYWVLDSDFNNYSIVISCTPTGPGNSFQILWFLARERNPGPGIRDLVRNKIAQLGLGQYLVLRPTVQENCPENKLTII